MFRKAILVGLVSAALAGTTFQAVAENKTKTAPMGSEKTEQRNQQTMDADGQRMPGYQMMTPQERETYNEKLSGMDSMEERQAYREKHHKMMQDRAQAEGKMIDDLPPTAAGKTDGKSKMENTTGGGDRAIDDSAEPDEGDSR